MTQPHRAVKSLGQNFLTDKRLLQKIVDSCNISSDETVLEIGPGQGALTECLLQKNAAVIAVEKDRKLIPLLKEKFVDKNLTLIEGDILQFDFSALPENLKIIGNIPYYISTPIIEKIIENKKKVTQAFLTVQLEFGQRLAAKPHSKEYGSLTLFAQYHFDVKVLFKIKAGCFNPKPKVDSCFVSLSPITRKIKVPEQELFTLIQTSFQQRRKVLSNALKTLITAEDLHEVLYTRKLSPNVRPENLSLDDFIALAERRGKSRMN